MEARQITIANTKTQKRDRFESAATTLGELKEELDARGIDYYGMSFTEGLSKTVLIDDSSVLPTNLTYKGQKTNDLVILLTNTEKKIASGMDRKDVFVIIKTNNLQEDILNEFHKNYTNVSTQDLIDFLIDHNMMDSSEDDDDNWSNDDYNTAPMPEKIPHKEIADWFYEGIRELTNKEVLVTKDVEYLSDLLADYVISLHDEESGISNADIDAMIDSLC